MTNESNVQSAYDNLKNSFYGFQRKYPDLSYFGNIPAQYSENTVSPIQWQHWMEGCVNLLQKEIDATNEDLNHFIDAYNQFISEISIANQFKGNYTANSQITTADNYKIETIKLGNVSNMSDDIKSINIARKIAVLESNENKNYLKNSFDGAIVTAKGNDGWLEIPFGSDSNAIIGGQNFDVRGNINYQNINSNNPADIIESGKEWKKIPLNSIPQNVNRIFPIAYYGNSENDNVQKDGAAIYMNADHQIFYVELPDGTPKIISTEKSPLFILTATSIPDESKENILSFTYIATDYSVNTIYQSNITGNQNELVVAHLPKNVIDSITSLSPEKVIGNAHQIVALVPGNQGDNKNNFEHAITWNYENSSIDGTNKIEKAFTPRDFFDAKSLTRKTTDYQTGIESTIFFSTSPDDTYNGTNYNLGINNDETTKKSKKSTPIDTAQGLVTDEVQEFQRGSYGFLIGTVGNVNQKIENDANQLPLGNKVNFDDYIAIEFYHHPMADKNLSGLLTRQLQALNNSLKQEIEQRQKDQKLIADTINHNNTVLNKQWSDIDKNPLNLPLYRMASIGYGDIAPVKLPTVEKMRDQGATISMTTLVYVNSATDSNPISCDYTKLRSAIDSIQNTGTMVTMLKPHINLYGQLDSFDRTTYNPDNYDYFFNNWKNLLLEYAKICNEKQIEILCIGCEMKQTINPIYLPKWQDIVSAIKSLYPDLKITYAMSVFEFNDLEGTAQIASVCDFIGFNTYPSLTTKLWKNYVNYFDLIPGWYYDNGQTDFQAKIDYLCAKYNKTAILTEVGYMPQEDSINAMMSATPYGTPNFDVLVEIMKALFTIIKSEKNIVGMAWWGSDDVPFTYFKLNEYTKTEQAITDFYTKGIIDVQL